MSIGLRRPIPDDPDLAELWEIDENFARSELTVVHPYNTYVNPGLPPGPICSPGLGSFMAVLKPAETRALYFVADTKGGHIFSETNEEQNDARRLRRHELKKYKEKLKAQKHGVGAP